MFLCVYMTISPYYMLVGYRHIDPIGSSDTALLRTDTSGCDTSRPPRSLPIDILYVYMFTSNIIYQEYMFDQAKWFEIYI